MFIDAERAYFVARARREYQARRDAAVGTSMPRRDNLAWAYALLDEAEDAPGEDRAIGSPRACGAGPDAPADAPRTASPMSAIRTALRRTLESPVRATAWIVGRLSSS